MDSMSLLNLFEFTSVSFLSAKNTADVCRIQLEKLLVLNKIVEIDFTNVYVTPGFLRFLLEPLMKKQGPHLLERIFFANHTEATLYNINQVLEQFNETEPH